MTATVRQLAGRVGVVWLGAIALAVGITVTLIFYLGIWQNLIRDEGRTVRIEFSDAYQLQVGDELRLDGIEEGRVNEIENLPGGRGALVEVDVAESAGPLYEDASADLRWRLLLGGAFYVKLDRGTPGKPPLGDARIPMQRTSQQVELDDIGQVFQTGARQGLRTLPGEMSRALADDRAPARALETLAERSPSLRTGLEALRGEAPDRDLRRLVTGTASTVRALDTPRDDLRALLGGVGTTLETTAARSDEIRAAIGRGPKTMAAIDATLARLDPTLTGADGLVRRLMPAADEVAPTLSALRPTLVDTDELLDRARPLLQSLRPAVRSLAGTADDGVPLLDSLRPSLDRLEDTIIPYLAKEDPESGKSTTVMIGGTAAGFGGSAGQQDSNGHMIRFPATLGESAAYLPCRNNVTDPSQPDALACDSLEDALNEYLGYTGGTAGGDPGEDQP